MLAHVLTQNRPRQLLLRHLLTRHLTPERFAKAAVKPDLGQSRIFIRRLAKLRSDKTDTWTCVRRTREAMRPYTSLSPPETYPRRYPRARWRNSSSTPSSAGGRLFGNRDRRPRANDKITARHARAPALAHATHATASAQTLTATARTPRDARRSSTSRVRGAKPSSSTPSSPFDRPSADVVASTRAVDAHASTSRATSKGARSAIFPRARARTRRPRVARGVV